MASVNEIHGAGFQARVFRGGKVAWHAFFSHNQWGGKAKAKAAANSKAQQMEVALAPYFSEPRSNTGITGISKTRCPRKRSGKEYVEISFQVEYVKFNIHKKFYVGREGQYTPFKEVDTLMRAAEYLRSELRACGIVVD